MNPDSLEKYFKEEKFNIGRSSLAAIEAMGIKAMRETDCNNTKSAAEKQSNFENPVSSDTAIVQKPASPELFSFILNANVPQPYCELDLKSISALSLAYIGDAAYELIMREYLLRGLNAGSRLLHSKAIKLVNSHAQASAAEHIMPMLNDDELEAFKRGRNAHTGHIPKGSNTYLYHMATGLECLYGYHSGSLSDIRRVSPDSHSVQVRY